MVYTPPWLPQRRCLKGIEMTRTMLAVIGVISLIMTVPAGMLGYWLLPPGQWPAVLAGLPALPFLWFGLVCLRKAGFKVPIVKLAVGVLVLLLLFIVLGALLVLVFGF